MQEKLSYSPKLSLTTDFNGSRNHPSEPIGQMAKAGFEYTMWYHEWNTNHLYTPQEIRSFKDTVSINGIQVLDTHASEGSEALGAFWLSDSEEIRQSGINLIENRIELTHELGGKAAVLHVPAEDDRRFNWRQFAKSMEELRPVIESTGVPIAFENIYTNYPYKDSPENFPTIVKILKMFGPEIAGMCLDTGHWNLEQYGYNSQSPLWEVKDRIVAVHLHDNPGRDPKDIQKDKDDHMLPYSGTVPWTDVTRFLANSSYSSRPLSFESSLKKHKDAGMTINGFLTIAKLTGTHLAGQVNDHIRDRQILPSPHQP